MNDTLAMILIVVGLVFAGGVISFVKQKMPTGVIVLMGLGSALFLALGIERWITAS